MTEAENDGRMSFDEAVRFVQDHPDKAAFTAMPVFGERTDNEEQRAEGARIFVLQADGAGSHRMYFVAGPFFANVFAATETFAAADIPDSVHELRFMPSRFDEEWLTEQVQVLIQKLMQASGTVAPEMPDYSSTPAPAAGETVVPINIVRKP